MSTFTPTSFPSVTPPPLPASSRRGWLGQMVAGLVGVGTALSPLALIAVVSPGFAELFRDFGFGLSRPTTLVLDIGAWLWTPGGLLGVVLLAVVGAAIAVVAARRASLALGVLLVGVVIGLVGCAAVMFLLQTPAAKVVESLQGSGAV